jgi:predicted CXXCH cytochrome family protein
VTNRHKTRWPLLLLTILTIVFPGPSVQAFDFDGCEVCHEETLQRDYIRLYLHSPYAARKCGKCHAAVISDLPAEQKSAKNISANRVQRKKTVWLGDSSTVNTKHSFLLPSQKVGDTLVVELQGVDGKFSHKEIAVPLLADLIDVKDAGQPPVISGVHVLKVERGVFLSVTVGWRTDTLADAVVLYGDEDLSQTSDKGTRFGLQHQVVLHNLTPDRTYRYSVVSHDLFGRSQVSEPRTFSTEKPFTAANSDDIDNPSNGEPSDSVDNTFQRLGTDYLFQLELAEPSSVFVGSKGPPRRQSAPDAEKGAAIADEKSHAGLSSKVVISMRACGSCHKNQSTATHPVNVYPKPGMVIPPEYPTLPDGRITCNSCHNLHGSDYEFLARKQGKRELCVGCHLDMM